MHAVGGVKEITMSGEEKVFSIMSGWQLNTCWLWYLLWVAAGVVVIRAIIAAFKGLAIAGGEHMENTKEVSPEDRELQKASFIRRWWSSFLGFGPSHSVNDYWLPALVGMAELAAYPVLIVTGNIAVIGAWIAIKTTGQWRVWAQSRTAFNRYLFANLLTISVSYFGLLRFVARVVTVASQMTKS